MKKQTQKMIANEIVQNIKMLLYGLLISFLVVTTLFVIFYPPKNGSIPREIIQEYKDFKNPPQQYYFDGESYKPLNTIREQRFFSFGDVLKNKSYYDKKIPIDDAILGNSIDYFRWKYHWRFVWKYTKLALILLLPGVVILRYLILLVRWVGKNANEDDKTNSSEAL
jgi:hypothetical protein